MERGPAPKAVTELEARRADRGPGQTLAVADGRGPRRPTSSARPFDGTTDGMGDTRDPTGMRWLGYGGPATICGAEAISGVDPMSAFDASRYVNRSLHADVPFALRIRELMAADLLGSRALVRAEIRRVVDYCAMCGRLRVGKSFLQVCSIGRRSHVFGL